MQPKASPPDQSLSSCIKQPTSSFSKWARIICGVIGGSFGVVAGCFFGYFLVVPIAITIWGNNATGGDRAVLALILSVLLGPIIGVRIGTWLGGYIVRLIIKGEAKLKALNDLKKSNL